MVWWVGLYWKVWEGLYWKGWSEGLLDDLLGGCVLDGLLGGSVLDGVGVCISTEWVGG